MTQTTTQQRAHRITIPKPQRPPTRAERMEAEAEAREADARAAMATAQRIGSLLPSLQSESKPSRLIGGPPAPESNMPSDTDASTLAEPLPIGETNPSPTGSAISTSTPDGGHGAKSPVSGTPQVSRQQTALTAPRMFSAREIQEAIRNNPLEAANLTDSLPPALKQALRGNRRDRMSSRPEPGQLEIPSLSNDFWCVRLRQRAYAPLKAFVEAQDSLRDLGSEQKRQATIAKIRAAAIERQNEPDAGQQAVADAQAEVWWAALGQYPPWAIYAAGMKANAENKFAPRPAEVAEIARKLTEPVRIRLEHAAYAVADIEKLRPEWCE